MARFLRLLALGGLLFLLLDAMVDTYRPPQTPEIWLAEMPHEHWLALLCWLVVVSVQLLVWFRNEHIEKKQGIVTQQVETLKQVLADARTERATLLEQRDAERARFEAALKESQAERALYTELASRLKRHDLRVDVAERDQLLRDVHWLATALREGLATVPPDVSLDVQRRVAPLATPARGTATVEAWLERLAPHALEYKEVAGVAQAWNPPSLPAHERQAREALLLGALLHLEASVAAVTALPPETARTVFDAASRLLWRSPPLALRHRAAEARASA